MGEVEPTVPSKYSDLMTKYFIPKNRVRLFKGLIVSTILIKQIFSSGHREVLTNILLSRWVQRGDGHILEHEALSLGPRRSNRTQAILALLLPGHECGSLRYRLSRP